MLTVIITLRRSRIKLYYLCRLAGTINARSPGCNVVERGEDPVFWLKGGVLVGIAFVGGFIMMSFIQCFQSVLLSYFFR